MIVALSIRQPWAWLICHAGKDIENRTWRTLFRGRFLIHASAGMTRAEYEAAEAFYVCTFRNGPPLPGKSAMLRGGIVGEAELVDCVDTHTHTHLEADWFFGPYGFVLRNVQPLPFLPCKGALGFFTSPLFDQFQ